MIGDEIEDVQLTDANGTQVHAQWSFVPDEYYFGQLSENGTIHLSESPHSLSSVYQKKFAHNATNPLPEGHYTNTVSTQAGETVQKSMYFPGHVELDSPEFNATLESDHVSFSWSNHQESEEIDHYSMSAYLPETQDSSGLFWASMPANSTQAVLSLDQLQDAAILLSTEELQTNSIAVNFMFNSEKENENGMAYARGFAETVRLDIPLK